LNRSTKGGRASTPASSTHSSHPIGSTAAVTRQQAQLGELRYALKHATLPFAFSTLVQAAALLAVARHCSSQPMLALSFVGILETSRSLKQRVERLLARPTPTRPQLGGSGWITILALALLVVPMGFSQRVVHTQQQLGIPDQHTAVLISEGRTVPGGSQRQRIVLITPTLIDPADRPVNPEPR